VTLEGEDDYVTSVQWATNDKDAMESGNIFGLNVLTMYVYIFDIVGVLRRTWNGRPLWPFQAKFTSIGRTWSESDASLVLAHFFWSTRAFDITAFTNFLRLHSR
jgi:hypothetical protein